MQVKLIPFKIGHFDLLDKRPDINPCELDVLPLATYESFPSHTMIIDGRVIACGGLILMWPGTARIWLFTVPDLSRYKENHRIVPLEVFKVILDQWIRVFQLKRVEAVVQDDFPPGHKLVKWFGFKPEGCMKKLMGDKDYTLYALIVE